MNDDEALDTRGVEHLIGYLLAVADVPARRIFQRHIGTPFGLRPVEFTLLVLLLGNGHAAPKQLAQTLRVPAPAVTVLVDRLAGRGLVERRRSATDGRAFELRLTDKGSELARRVQRISLTMEEPLLQPLSPGERAMLRELLAKLARGG